MASEPLLLLLVPLCSAELQGESPVELPEECSVLVGVQLVELAGLVVEQLALEALALSGLTALLTVPFPAAVVAALVAAVATAAVDLLLSQPGLELEG